MGGLTGMILTGILCDSRVNSAGLDGAVFGRPVQLGHHLAEAAAVAPSVFVLMYLICRFVKLFIPLRLSEEDEKIGSDVSQHGHKPAGVLEAATLINPSPGEGDLPTPIV